MSQEFRSLSEVTWMDIFPRHCMVWIILLLSDRVCSLSALKVVVQWPCFLGKQPTLHVATTGFRTKQYQRNQCWNSIPMACHYQDWLVLVIRLLPIVLALFLLFFGFASIFLRFIPKSTASIILDFRLITCIILCQKAQSDFIYVVQSRILPSF